MGQETGQQHDTKVINVGASSLSGALNDRLPETNIKNSKSEIRNPKHEIRNKSEC